MNLLKSIWKALRLTAMAFLRGGLPEVFGLINDLRAENEKLRQQIEKLKQENDKNGY